MTSKSCSSASTNARKPLRFGSVLVALISLGILVPAAVAATGPAVPALNSLDREIPALLEKWQVPGAAVAVALDGRIVLARGYGLADKESNVVVQPDTRFRLASCTKPITAAMTLKLVEQGRLSLDDRPFVLLNYPTPTYAGAQRDPRLDQITVRQLLNHTAGWNRDTAVPPFPVLFGSWEPTYYQEQVGELMRQSPASAETTARFMVGQPLQFTPGTAYAYSNVGYLILGRLIEMKLGYTLTYERLMQQFLATVGISGEAVARSPRAWAGGDEAIAYDYPGAPLLPSVFGPGLEARPYCEMLRTLDSHGGLAMSAIEYLRFLLALDGASGGAPLLQPATVAAMRTAQSPAVDYGYGWMTRVGPFGGSGHTGDLPGTFTIAVRSGDGRVQWVVLCNSCPCDAAGLPATGGIQSDLLSTMRTAELALRAAPAPEHDFAGSTLDLNGWQMKYFNVSTPFTSWWHDDSDLDGVPNLIEYAASLDPTRTDAVPAVSFATLPDGTPALTYRRPILEQWFHCRVEMTKERDDWGWYPSLTLRRTTLNADGTLSVTVALPGATHARLVVEAFQWPEWMASMTSEEIAITAAPVARLLNLSTRGRVSQGEGALIAGFVVQGTQPRTFLLRGVGPTLAVFGVNGALADPKLRVFSSDAREIGCNDNWSVNAAGLASAASELGGFPLASDSADAGLLITLKPGAYTAQLTPATSSTPAGNGLIEIYEADRGASSLSNLSCRARAGGESGELMTGFVIAGDRPRAFLLRAVGPGLRAFGVTDALAAPSLKVLRNGTTLAQNSGWSLGTPAETEALVAAMRRVAAFDLAVGSGDAVLLLTLAPGDYTLQIAPSGAGSGIVLAEVYDLP